MVCLIPRRIGVREDGVVVVLTAFIFVGLVGVAALVVDIVNIHQARLRAQATADATVLAAVQDLDDLPVALAKAREYASRNFDVGDFDWFGCVDPEPLAVATDIPCISIDDAGAPTKIRVHLPNRPVPAFFATVLGKTGFEVTASATAEIEWFVTSPGSPGGGADPFAPSVRDGYTGGWPACEDPNFWEVEVDEPPEPEPEFDKKGKLKKPKKKKSGGNSKWREYIFVFEHTDGSTTTWCGTNRYDPWGLGEKETQMPGGTSTSDPYSMVDVHVSCSANFASGWSTKGHPNPFDDPEWRVVFYRLDKRFDDDSFFPCEKNEFTPLAATPPVIEPLIRLSD